ncbi:MAG: hypothetical protein IJK61_01425 [Bacteroidetes bacterium]|nr:hypothetical protein [Bacteroidota bacterium]
MKNVLSILVAFMVSLPLMAQHINPIFIGNINPIVKDSILSDFNSGKYDSFLNRSVEPIPPGPCDYLYELNDTSGCDWNTIPWNNYAVVVILPQFPNCPIYVNYEVRICPNNPSIRQINILLFAQSIPNYADCDSLTNYLNYGTDLEKAIKLEDLEEQLYFEISNYEAEQMANFPPCDSIGNNLPQYIFYNKSTCRGKIKITVLFDQQPDPLDIFFDVVCNREDSVCCRTIISYCQDFFGNVTSQITKETTETICQGAYPIEFDYEYIFDKFSTHTILYYELFPCTNSCR